MSKKKKHHKAPVTPSHQKPRTYEEIIAHLKSFDPEHEARIAYAEKVELLQGLIFISILIFGIYQYEYNKDVLLQRLQVLPRTAQLIIFGGFFVLSLISTAYKFKELILRHLVHWAIPESSPVTRPRIKSAISNIALLVYALCLYLYLQGVILAIAKILQAKISQAAAYFLANVIGWIISGVIGNFAYDILKRSVRRLQTPGSETNKK